MNQILETKLNEFRKAYEGILSPEQIEAGVAWYRELLATALEQYRKEIADKVAGMNEEDYFPLTQAILSAFEHRGFYDTGKYIDPTIWDFVKPEIITLLSTPLEKK